MSFSHDSRKKLHLDFLYLGAGDSKKQKVARAMLDQAHLKIGKFLEDGEQDTIYCIGGQLMSLD